MYLDNVLNTGWVEAEARCTEEDFALTGWLCAICISSTSEKQQSKVSPCCPNEMVFALSKGPSITLGLVAVSAQSRLGPTPEA